MFVSVCVELLLMAAYPVLFPPTRAQPILVPARVLWEAAGAITGGAVAARAGGAPSVVLYVLFQLALSAAQLPGRAFACSRTPPNFAGGACDPLAAFTGNWTVWVAFALGVAAARALVATEPRENTLLRAVGVVGLCTALFSAVGSLLLFVVILPNTPSAISAPGPFPIVPLSDIATYALAAGELIGCTLAGVFLARRPFAAPLLVGLLVIGPSFALGAPLWRTQGFPPSMPAQMWLGVLAWLWAPVAAVVALIIAWSLARRRNRLVARM